MKFDFDYYFIDKPAYALTLLFDAIFDAGLNEAVKWDACWKVAPEVSRADVIARSGVALP